MKQQPSGSTAATAEHGRYTRFPRQHHDKYPLPIVPEF